MRRGLGLLAAAAALVLGGAAAPADVADRIATLDRLVAWRQVSALPIDFDAHHPQGMTRVGGDFFLTAVEVSRPPRPLPPGGRHDRDPGAGRGWLFKMSAEGRLLAAVQLGEGDLYHPGGLDYDGRHLWTAVAEYRPDSRAVVYRIDPATLRAEAVLRVDDHRGAEASDAATNSVVGVGWGGRRLYRWTLGDDGRPTGPPTTRRNTAHYVAYQDCDGAGGGRILCSGVARYGPPGQPGVQLGGVELLDARTLRPLWLASVPAWTPGGASILANPSWFEATEHGLRAWVLPEDGRSTLYVYETTPPRLR